MKERPILFSALMVRAILDGRKTVTRRVVKFNIAGRIGPLAHQWHVDNPGAVTVCPYGQPGDRLWVRETFCLETNFDVESAADYPPPFNDGRPIKWTDPYEYGRVWHQPHYAATDPCPELDIGVEGPGCRWKPSIHMPRWASRITLEVTGVRVERLQDITPAQILAEGVRIPATPEGRALIDISTKHGPAAFLPKLSDASPDDLLRAHWAALWVQINGIDSWNANPWVWVVEFKRVEVPAS